MKHIFLSTLTAVTILAAPVIGRAQGIFVSIAGSLQAGFSGDGGPATAAALNVPSGLAVDKAGNVFLADLVNFRVRKIDTAGKITTVAGNGQPGTAGDGGPAINAQLFSKNASLLQGIAVDGAGNLYVSDYGNNRVRKVDPAGNISTVAGGGSSLAEGAPANKSLVLQPESVAVDAVGNLYIGNLLGVRRVDPAGIITTVAGNGQLGFGGDGGPAVRAQVSPMAIAVDRPGNLYINDYINHRIRKVDTAGIITTFAGDGTGGLPSGDGGPATQAALFSPIGITADASGNFYCTAGVPGGVALRKVDPAGTISSIRDAGNSILLPIDVAVDAAGNIYITDTNRVLKLAAAPASPPAISANGVVNAASFQAGVVANSWVTITGTSLASQTDDWSNSIVNGKLPTTLDGVSVSIGGKPADVYFISPGQINVLAPDVAPGPVTVTVTTSAGVSSSFTTTASLYGPAFFTWSGSQPVATRQDFTFAVKPGTFAGLPTVAAKPGDVLILWGTGFGPTNPAAPTGVAVPAGALYATATTPTVTINNVPATVFGSVLSPGSAGLYQIAIQVPNTLADGDWPIQAGIGGVQSPAGVLLTVRH